MNTTGLDLIARRQRNRSLRDLALAAAIVVLATLGLGALSASARTATFDQPDRPTSAVPVPR